MASGAKGRMREELGTDFDDMDWKKLDRRQYDPRRIIREALQASPDIPSKAVAARLPWRCNLRIRSASASSREPQRPSTLACPLRKYARGEEEEGHQPLSRVPL